MTAHVSPPRPDSAGGKSHAGTKNLGVCPILAKDSLASPQSLSYNACKFVTAFRRARRLPWNGRFEIGTALDSLLNSAWKSGSVRAERFRSAIQLRLAFRSGKRLRCVYRSSAEPFLVSINSRGNR